jgi:hypothetical protein
MYGGTNFRKIVSRPTGPILGRVWKITILLQAILLYLANLKRWVFKIFK